MPPLPYLQLPPGLASQTSSAGNPSGLIDLDEIPFFAFFFVYFLPIFHFCALINCRTPPFSRADEQFDHANNNKQKDISCSRASTRSGPDATLLQNHGHPLHKLPFNTTDDLIRSSGANEHSHQISTEPGSGRQGLKTHFSCLGRFSLLPGTITDQNHPGVPRCCTNPTIGISRYINVCFAVLP